MEYNRQTDLSKQLDNNDLKALAKAFAKKGWACGTAEILQVARSNASSNHWKDIVYEYLVAKEQATAIPPADVATEKAAGAPPAAEAPKQRRRSKKSEE